MDKLHRSIKGKYGMLMMFIYVRKVYHNSNNIFYCNNVGYLCRESV